ncbi:Flp pilus assembly protein CpaB [Microvirga tunisiensis]|uniref:Flp pilus assembly protein CpaB n=1 Tax=Microvirga tunisiensis TaxID=2108360 RepID=A0A5N7MBX3_9HYPH|nr:Flp pilus assembly protein CpaB [Microvirga tunisiensis]MPR08147.1 Flp pilus assembly protein CpaB [Microvirga tunisiensis]MPR24140.1 Flp pilus assembly protein CpaB [Microvirga tunisiensis]
MKPARALVFGVAILSGGGVAFIAGQNSVPPPPPAQIIQAPAIRETERTVEVLVAAQPLEIGRRIGPGDLKWQRWPESIKPDDGILHSPNTNLDSFDGALVRTPLIANDLITPEKLITEKENGFLAAMLSPDMRAIAIPIDGGGADTAGGFVLPNDRVDIIRVEMRDPKSGGPTSQVILSNVRILAIGNFLREEKGSKTIAGRTATLEVTPGQAEMIVSAQKMGSLTMALRPFEKDAARVPQEAKKDTKKEEQKLTIIRSGVAAELTQ